MVMSKVKKNHMVYKLAGNRDRDATMMEFLRKALRGSCIVVGLPAVVQTLSRGVYGALFCVLAPPEPGDSATHLLEVLLEAYCYENDIPILKVPDAYVLSNFLNSDQRVQCVLIELPSLLVQQPTADGGNERVDATNGRFPFGLQSRIWSIMK